MRIALIGSPESGKSELGVKLAEAFSLPCIDNYAVDLADSTHLWIGHASRYVPNMLVALERIKREFSNSTTNGRITCGTAVETMAYCAVYSSRVKEDSSPDEIARDNVESALIMNAINLMMDENWRYDFVFYLPTKSQRKMNRELDYAIREVLATLSIDHTPLTDEDQFAQAMRVIWSRATSETSAT